MFVGKIRLEEVSYEHVHEGQSFKLRLIQSLTVSLTLLHSFDQTLRYLVRMAGLAYIVVCSKGCLGVAPGHGRGFDLLNLLRKIVLSALELGILWLRFAGPQVWLE